MKGLQNGGFQNSGQRRQRFQNSDQRRHRVFKNKYYGGDSELKKLQLKQEVVVQPHMLNLNTLQIVKEKLWQGLRRSCSISNGYIMELVKIEEIKQGSIESRTGSVIYPVTFTVKVLKPSVGDIIHAQITQVNKLGFNACLGPFIVYVPRDSISEQVYKYEWDEKMGARYTIVGEQNGFCGIEPGVMIYLELIEIKMIRLVNVSDDEDEEIDDDDDWNGNLRGMCKIDSKPRNDDCEGGENNEIMKLIESLKGETKNETME